MWGCAYAVFMARGCPKLQNQGGAGYISRCSKSKCAQGLKTVQEFERRRKERIEYRDNADE